MTEDEAKTKWCPFVRMIAASTEEGVVTPAAFNRTSTDKGTSLPAASACIGSACMAWRWGQKRNPDWKPEHQMMATYPRHPADEPRLYIEDSENGYCGLAGVQR